MTHQTLENVSSSQDPWDWAAVSAHCHAVTRGILSSPAAAEDAAQEALVRAWGNQSRDAVRNPKAWLTRIARNEALRVGARDAGLARRYVPEDEVELAATAEGGGLWDRFATTAVLASLPQPDRQILYLRYVEDLTQTEVANRLGIPEGTAKVRLHRARKRLETEFRKG